MTQKIQFYTTKLFSEVFLSKFKDGTIPFSSNNIYQCLKELFAGTQIKSQEYVEEYFDNVELDYLSIYLSELEKVEPQSTKNYQYLFDSKTNSFSFVDETLWSNLEIIIFDKSKECFSGADKKKSLKDNLAIMEDYKKLLHLFWKRVLFIAVF